MAHPGFYSHKKKLVEQTLPPPAEATPAPAGPAAPLMGPIAQKILAAQGREAYGPSRPGNYQPVQQPQTPPPKPQAPPAQPPTDWTNRGEPVASQANLTGNQLPTVRQQLWGKSAEQAAPKPAPLMG